MRPPAGEFVRLLGLGDAATDGEIDQLLVPLTPGAPVIDLRLAMAVLVVTVGVDGAERASAARLRPVTGRHAGGHGHALAPLHEGRTSTPPMRIALIDFMPG